MAIALAPARTLDAAAIRDDFPLLAREVKPWPGLVDVEQFPATYKGDD